jgi:trimeric autotransporter adhesin
MGTGWFAGIGSLRRGVPVFVSAALVVAALAGGGPAAAAAQPGDARAPQGSAAGIISTVAGGVGGPARATRVAIGPYGPCGVSSGGGSVYIGDHYSVRQVDPKTDWLTTPAGVGSPGGTLGTGGPAADSTLNDACATAVDHSGNLIIANVGFIEVVAARDGRFYGQPMTAGDIYIVAGGGRHVTGSGVPATSVALISPGGVAVDAHGNLVLAESSTQNCGHCRLFTSVIEVVAVSSGRFYGQAMIAGDIYVIGGDRNLSTVSGDGGPARKAGLGFQLGDVRVDQAGNVVFDQWDVGTIRVVAAHTGTYYGQAMTAHHIYTIAGNGTNGYAGDGGPATSAELSGPFGLALDQAGNLLIADTGNSRLRAVAARTGHFWGRHMTAGDIYTIAGDGMAGFSGDGGPATSAELSGPDNVVLDGAGNLVISDGSNFRVRVVAARTGTFYRQAMTAGHIYTIAGTGGAGFSGMGGRATAAEFGSSGLTVDSAGNMVISSVNRVLLSAARSGTFFGKAMGAGNIYSVAGNGTAGYSGDGGPATSAELDNPVYVPNLEQNALGGVAVDSAGNLVIADSGNNRVRVVAAHTGTYYGTAMTAGHIYAIAGDGTAGYSGNGGPATSAALNSPADVKVDSAGNLVIADSGNNRVRVVAAHTGTYYGTAMTAGDIYTVAGDGTAGFSGDGGLATSAEVVPAAVALDAAGNVVIAEQDRIRVVAVRTGTFYGQAMTAGDIYTVAGDGGFGNSGDGGPATSASVTPYDVTVDPGGNLMIPAGAAVRVVAVSSGTFDGVAMTAGDIYTVAGDGAAGFSGDGGPATSAEVTAPAGVLVTSARNLLFAAGDRVRMVTGGPTASAAPPQARRHTPAPPGRRTQ